MSAMMPPKAGLAMQPQRLDQAPAPGALHLADAPRRGAMWRLAVFAPALIGTAALLAGLYSWLNMGGMTWLEWSLLVLIGLSFVWVTLSVSTVLVGLAGLLRRRVQPTAEAGAMDVALLVPIYNEVPSDVFGNAAAMLDDLARQSSHHRFSLFILSDTRDETIAAQEVQALEALRRDAPEGIEVFFRRRAQNTDKKVGNLVDWITG